MKRLTEAPSNYNQLENMDVVDILNNINNEDQKVATSIQKVIPEIHQFLEVLIPRMKQGGRLFYIGAGTSGRLGIVDASECPPTFGVSDNVIIGIMAGGDSAMRKAVEFAEDNPSQAWLDLQKYQIDKADSIIGIAASGTTPYVVGGIQDARKFGLLTASICCNAKSPLSKASQYPIEVIVGPEFVTGSTRMKAGTAQKLILNMISTTIMIKMGRVRGNKMIDMQLTNNKLVDRGTLMVAEATGLDYQDAQTLLKSTGSVRAAIDKYKHE